MIVLILIIVASFVWWTWLTRTKPDEPPAVPGAWPIIGHGYLLMGDSLQLWQFMKNIMDYSIKMGASYVYIGNIKIYAVTDPDDIFKIANTCLEKDKYCHILGDDLLGGGLLLLPGCMTKACTCIWLPLSPIWKRHRKLIAPTFNQQILDEYMPVFNNQSRRLIKQLAKEVDGQPFDQLLYVRSNFVETICLTALDGTISEEEAEIYANSFETYLSCGIARFQRFWLHNDFFYKFSALKKSKDECIKALRNISESVLRNKRAQKIQNKYEINKENSGNTFKTFIEMLLDLDEGELTDQEILDEVNTIITAGYDTAATVATYAFLLIGSYPEVQEKLHKELQEVFGSTDRDVEKEDLSRLVYLEAVLKETMRCYEVAPLITRYIDQEVKLKTCTLQPGNNCFLMLHSIHQSPMWGPDVNEFKPERWLDGTLPTDPNAFASFSLGKRGCIGKRYGMMSLLIMFSHVLRRYKIRSDHTKLVLKLDILLKPVAGHQICLEDRLK